MPSALPRRRATYPPVTSQLSALVSSIAAGRSDGPVPGLPVGSSTSNMSHFRLSPVAMEGQCASSSFDPVPLSQGVAILSSFEGASVHPTWFSSVLHGTMVTSARFYGGSQAGMFKLLWVYSSGGTVVPLELA